MPKQMKFENQSLPNHIAIIMDGNGRWASKRFLTKKAGHKAGADVVEKISKLCDKIGIRYLTVYAFSTENWKRSAEEVSGLMDLLGAYLDSHIKKAKKDNIVTKVIGDISALDENLQKKINVLTELTKNKTGMTFIIALNYGGRDEIVRAINKMRADNITHITEDDFGRYLDTADIPDPDLLIRTSGEQRISNFMLWQLAYTEFYFTDTLWPDFSENDLYAAITAYQDRERRFGGR